MNQILGKQALTRLKAEDYRELRRQVLKRDGWRCQLCGTISNLEVHHKEFRSHSGEDDEQNLITLYLACHSSVHVRTLVGRVGITDGRKAIQMKTSSREELSGRGQSARGRRA